MAGLLYRARVGNGKYKDVILTYNPNDIRHVIRKLGETYTLTSIANVLGVSTSEISRWCTLYCLPSKYFPPNKHQVSIFKLAEDIANKKPSVMRRLKQKSWGLWPVSIST